MVSSLVKILVAIGLVAFFVGLYFLRSKLLQGAARKQTRRQYLEREKERDRRACLSAAMSLDSGTAPREAFAIPGTATGAGAPVQRLRNLVEDRRRAATSTDFDRDMPSA